MLELAVKVLIAYMLGSVSGSMVMGALRHVDIRESGSGNAGGTNALRTQGFRFALGVVLIDVGKGVLACSMAGWELAALGEPLNPEITLLACGFAAVVGHCFPVWYGFRGGKGAATAVGALAVIQPWALLPMFLSWVLVLIITGWVGLATILASISLLPAFWYLGATRAALIFAVALALFIIAMHQSNIRNLVKGSEHRFERVRIANWFKKA